MLIYSKQTKTHLKREDYSQGRVKKALIPLSFFTRIKGKIYIINHIEIFSLTSSIDINLFESSHNS